MNNQSDIDVSSYFEHKVASSTKMLQLGKLI